MKWQTKRFNDKEWHRWFAWHPVTIVEMNSVKTIVWLEYVQRRAEWYWDDRFWVYKIEK